jgi:hypothetical protein
MQGLRPDSVTVGLYCDDVLYGTVNLSEETLAVYLDRSGGIVYLDG